MNGNPLVTLDGLGSLHPEIPPRPSYSARIQRAHELAETNTASAELLSFYAGVAACQQTVFEALQAAEKANTEGWALMLDRLAPLFPKFATALSEFSPPPIKERAKQLKSDDAQLRVLLEQSWKGELAGSMEADRSTDRFLALAFLQPYAEWLAQVGNKTSTVTRHATCPVCSSAPICAVLRDQDHGARRALICSLCMNEWNFERVLCPSCGEDRHERLPVFKPEDESTIVRVDACETCKTYIKTVDMTKTGVAVPVVDEIASVTLTLWAAEKGYKKLAGNLLGI